MTVTEKEYLLIKLGEECGEIQQRISKYLLFGKDNINPNNGIDNTTLLKEEVKDFLAILHYLSFFVEDGIDFKFVEQEELNKRIEKLKHWMEVSKEKNILTV